MRVRGSVRIAVVLAAAALFAAGCGEEEKQTRVPGCKGQGPSYKPAKQAVEAVGKGKFLVQPRPESWKHP